LRPAAAGVIADRGSRISTECLGRSSVSAVLFTFAIHQLLNLIKGKDTSTDIANTLMIAGIAPK
jgi:hypothetical protein